MRLLRRAERAEQRSEALPLARGFESVFHVVNVCLGFRV